MSEETTSEETQPGLNTVHGRCSDPRHSDNLTQYDMMFGTNEHLGTFSPVASTPSSCRLLLLPPSAYLISASQVRVSCSSYRRHRGTSSRSSWKSKYAAFVARHGALEGRPGDAPGEHSRGLGLWRSRSACQEPKSH